MKLCSRLLVFFGRNFCEKRQIQVSEPYFCEARGNARSCLMTRQLSVCVIWTFFTIYYGSGVMRRNAFSSAVLGSTSLHSNFAWTKSFPINHSWHQKTSDTALPDGEHHIPLRSLVLTRYPGVMDRRTDRWTDRWICRSIYCTVYSRLES